jgi:hypothetical protein
MMKQETSIIPISLSLSINRIALLFTWQANQIQAKKLRGEKDPAEII